MIKEPKFIMVVQMSQSEKWCVQSQVRLTILGKDSTQPLVFTAFGGLCVILDPTLNIH